MPPQARPSPHAARPNSSTDPWYLSRIRGNSVQSWCGSARRHLAALRPVRRVAASSPRARGGHGEVRLEAGRVRRLQPALRKSAADRDRDGRPDGHAAHHCARLPEDHDRRRASRARGAPQRRAGPAAAAQPLRNRRAEARERALECRAAATRARPRCADRSGEAGAAGARRIGRQGCDVSSHLGCFRKSPPHPTWNQCSSR
jgi:hypothetical protein